MNRLKPRRLQTTLAAAALVAGLAAPAAAQAAQSYIVTLTPPADTTCERTILDVSVAYGITLKNAYTTSLCGFSATMSKSTAEKLRFDSRVGSVTGDSTVTTAG